MAININIDKCTGCGNCVDLCPFSALTVVDKCVQVSEVCIDCGVCIDGCPVDALAL